MRFIVSIYLLQLVTYLFILFSVEVGKGETAAHAAAADTAAADSAAKLREL